MSLRSKSVCRVLGLLVAVQAADASSGDLARVRPSDCKPGDVDSTCATAVAGAPAAAPPSARPDTPLYDGPLGGVPAAGYAYWGFDFVADETGAPSLVRPDEFINRSNVPVTITLTFNVPTHHACTRDCIPGVQFQVDAGWSKLDPPALIVGDTASFTGTFNPGRGFGWVIGLWQATQPRLTVTVPKGSVATLREVGLPNFPATANEVPATTRQCDCWDGSSVACSDGSRYSNGLLGPWYQNWTNYARAGAFNNCPLER